MPSTLLDEILNVENSNTVKVYSNLNSKVELLTKQVDTLTHSIEKYSVSDALTHNVPYYTASQPFNASTGIVNNGASNLEKMMQVIADKTNTTTISKYEDSPNNKEDSRKETEHFIGEKNPLQDDEDTIAKYSKLIYELLKDWKGLFRDGKPADKLATGELAGDGSNIPWWALEDLKPQDKVKTAEKAKLKEAEEAKAKAEEAAQKAKAEAEKTKAEAEKTKAEAEKINDKVKKDIQDVKAKAAEEAEKAAKKIAKNNTSASAKVKEAEDSRLKAEEEVKKAKAEVEKVTKEGKANIAIEIEKGNLKLKELQSAAEKTKAEAVAKAAAEAKAQAEKEADAKTQKIRDEAATQARKDRNDAREARDKAAAEAEVKAKAAAEAETKAKTASVAVEDASKVVSKKAPGFFKPLLSGAGKALSTVFSDWSPLGIFGGEIVNPTSLGPRKDTPDYDLETGTPKEWIAAGKKAQNEFLGTIASKYGVKTGEELDRSLMEGKVNLVPEDREKYRNAYKSGKESFMRSATGKNSTIPQNSANGAIEVGSNKFTYNVIPEAEKNKDLGPLNDDQHFKDIHKSTSDIHSTMTVGFNTVAQAIYELAKTLHLNTSPGTPSQNVVVNAPANITPGQTPDASDIANNYRSSITSTRKSYLDAYNLVS
jgi:hypothetical protein